MINNNPRWALQITHIPTGVKVQTDSNIFRNQREAYDAMIKLLKSRLWAIDNQLSKEDLIATYDLSEKEYVDDLSDYRSSGIKLFSI